LNLFIHLKLKSDQS